MTDLWLSWSRIRRDGWLVKGCKGHFWNAEGVPYSDGGYAVNIFVKSHQTVHKH